MEQPKNRENREEAQERPCYYGTGRRRELDKSRLPLILSLLAVVLAANLLTIALHVRQNPLGSEETAQGETEDALSDVYPFRSPMQTSGEDESSSFGMELSALEDAERRYWDLPEGIIVRSIASGSSADIAGILSGDLLLLVGDTEIASIADYFSAIRNCKPGDILQLTIYRCGRQFVLPLQIPGGE